MKRVILETPYAGDIAGNIDFARACIRDCLKRGESPIASHLLFTQPGVLDDAKPEERELGISAGHEWYMVADACVVYRDRGISSGMTRGIYLATALNVRVIYRWLNKNLKAA